MNTVEHVYYRQNNFTQHFANIPGNVDGKMFCNFVAKTHHDYIHYINVENFLLPSFCEFECFQKIFSHK